MKLTMRKKIIAVVLLCVIVVTGISGGVGIASSTNVCIDQSKEILKDQVGVQAEKLNSSMIQIESTVDMLAEQCMGKLDDFSKFQTDAKYVEDYTKGIENMLLTSAENTKGALSCYIR